MSPKELAALMARHGLTDENAASILGISARLVRRYMDAEKPVPEPTARLLKILTGEAKAEDYL